MSETGLAPSFYYVVTPTGHALVRATDQPWPDHIGISDELIALGDPEFISSGDGMVRFTLPQESALYGFAHEADTPGINHYDWISA